MWTSSQATVLVNDCVIFNFIMLSNIVCLREGEKTAAAVYQLLALDGVEQKVDGAEV